MMKKFLKFSLKSQLKTLLIILVLVILQAVFQIQIIKLFGCALTDVENLRIDMLFDDAAMMLIYTALSVVSIYAVSYLSTDLSSKVAYLTREKIFHILMNLPDDEINKFKVTGLITRSTRGMYSEQGFITLMLNHFLIIPFVFLGVVIEIAFIDIEFAALFASLIIIIAVIVIFKLKQVTAIYFNAKKTYGKLNTLFFSKINSLADNVPFKKQKAHDEFKLACRDSYEKNITYQLSQYYIGLVLMLVLNVIVVFLLALMSSRYSIGFEAESVVDSVVIVQYILYFLSMLVVVPAIIERWPRSYATSVRLEEVLVLEDEIEKTENGDSQRIEIENEEKNIEPTVIIDRKEIIKKFNRVLANHRTKLIISMILVTVSTLCIAYAPKVAGNAVDMILYNFNFHTGAVLNNIVLLLLLYSLGFLLKLPSTG